MVWVYSSQLGIRRFHGLGFGGVGLGKGLGFCSGLGFPGSRGYTYIDTYVCTYVCMYVCR